MSELANIAIGMIRENPVALRTVNRQTESYLELVESIRQKGILNAPNVRRKTDAETGEEYFELIDGLHRYTAAKDAGLEEIPAQILPLNDAEVLEAQIIANLHVTKTTPSQFTKQIKRILTMNPLLSIAELAKNLGTSPQFIQQRLSLTKIESEEVMKLIDDGKISLANAYALAKLPVENQAEFYDRAMTQSPDEFIPAVQNRVKEIKEARRQGKEAGEAKWQPTAHFRKAKAVKEELENADVCKALVKKHGLKSAEEGFNMAIKWVLHLDPESVEAQKAKAEAEAEARAQAKAKKAAEKAAAKEEKLKAEIEEAAKIREEAMAKLAEKENAEG